MYSLNASEMAESTKVRLVRCPKCENLLPELADYSVYQCGGCGAVLRAKNKNQEAECSSENLEEEKPRGISSKSGNTSGKGIVDSSDASDADPSSNSGTLRNDQSELEKCDLDSAAICENESEFTAEKQDVDCGQSSDFIKVELSDAAGSEHQDLSSQYEYPGDSRRLRQMSDWKNGDEKQMGRLWRIPGNAADCVRISTSNPLNDGPSNQHLDSSFHNVSSRKYNDLDGASELGRAVLLRKLDELKEQLSRSCDVADKTKEKGPFEGSSVPLESSRGYTESRFPDGFGVAEKSSTLFSTNNHAAGPSHYGRVTEKLPYPIEHDLARQGLYPIHNPHYAAGPGYADSFGSQVLNRSPHQFPSEYQQQPAHPYFPEACIGTNQDPFMSYSQSSILHQPSCSCFLCYEKHRHIPATVSSTSFSHNRFPDIPCNPMLYQFDNPGAFGSHFNNSRCSMPPLNLRGTQAHSRWPSNVNSEMARFVRLRPQRVVVASGAQHCHPLYGGAPFLTCQNCFELLKFPKKVHSSGAKRQKLRCGACSSVIKFSVINKKLVLQDCVEEVVSPDLVDDSSTDFVKESTMHHHGHMNRVAADFSSDDYDNSDYDFQSLDIESVPPLNCRALNSMKPQEMPGFHSPASTSEDENSPDVLIPSIGVVNSFQHPIKTSVSPPPPGSPLQDYFDYSSNNNAVNRIGKGNRSARSDQEKVVSHKGATRQNSLKEASLVSEMEVSFNEFSNNETSQHPSDAAKNDQPKTTKGSESFFSNIIKKSFKDFSRSNHGEEYGKSNVSVNGHCIPERVVKKAQKAAGPIQAGHYWYDYRAGFWGVMNGPCLGIIPPFIEEFNYPMPEKCASGNTGVFVNGRELHQKDLDLLAGRGLPTDGDRSYIIEMSGRVLDEDTGEELDCLGKLAPTVEKVKRGFGMKVPRPAA